MNEVLDGEEEQKDTSVTFCPACKKKCEDVTKFLTSIGTSCVNAQRRWNLWNEVNNSRDNYKSEFQSSHTFWNHFSDALSLSVVAELGRVFDTTKRTASIGNALSAIEKLAMPEIDTQQLEEDVKKVSPKHNRLVENLRGRRNTQIAHTDGDGVKKETDWVQEYPLTYGDVGKLMELAWEVVGRYLKLLTGVTWHHPQLEDDEDFRRVLESVRKTLIDE